MDGVFAILKMSISVLMLNVEDLKPTKDKATDAKTETKKEEAPESDDEEDDSEDSGSDDLSGGMPKLFVGMILILIFAEALALYGLIVGIILSSRAGQSRAA
ncbi:unnamed protein product [Fraxinus pennsylvanica]|uniref:V-ATPase proteolipid subunit C-like domain-containing protein n=1 Tax=Fraxinus pennsylvanica TaxID=56036 RepID=A0AAD2E095_9LAMI|nr:unnamed protein product [Fraxinus pennsylvanica]